jgi:hypothetical protein
MPLKPETAVRCFAARSERSSSLASGPLRDVDRRIGAAHGSCGSASKRLPRPIMRLV